MLKQGGGRGVEEKVGEESLDYKNTTVRGRGCSILILGTLLLHWPVVHHHKEGRGHADRSQYKKSPSASTFPSSRKLPTTQRLGIF